MPLRHHLTQCLAVACSIALLTGLAQAQDAASAGLASQTALRSTIEKLIKESGMQEQVGVSIVSLTSGRTVFTHQAHRSRNPASNMKLVTSAVALHELGADYHMRTGLYGRTQGDAVVGGLYLKGHGDPTLSTADLFELARKLSERGIERVDELRVDAGYFDSEVLPPAFEQQPGEVAPFRAAVSAVSVDRNAYTLRAMPGTAAGQPARYHLTGRGYFKVDNQMTTSEGGTSSVVAIQSGQDGKMELKLRGKVPLGISGISYRRRVISPSHYAGYVMLGALRAMRIQVPMRVTLARAPPGTSLLAFKESPPLGELLSALGKYSDNFTAEMLLKLLGAEKVRVPGRSTDGVKVVLDRLKLLGVPTDKLKVVNGSGLFDGNQLSAAQLTKLLTAIYRDPALRPDFLSHLAVGGADGTLARRLTQLPAPRIVRAKTGTLADVIALSGYVLGPSPERGMAFSFLAEGVRGRQRGARSLADGIVGALARHLYAGSAAHPAAPK